MAKVKPHSLTIYDPPKCGASTDPETLPTSVSGKSFGKSAMSLVSEIQEKYENTIRMYKDLITYASTTEGTIKLSVMAVGMLGGGVLAIRSNSKRLWYRRMIPVGTLTLSAAICYPTHAYSISKKVAVGSYSGSVYLFKGTKKVWNYVADKYKELTPPPAEKKTEEEKVYIVGDGGITKVQEEALQPKEVVEKSEPKEQSTAEDKLPLSSTILHILPKSMDITSGEQDSSKTVSLEDPGQSSQEDTDLYTTRS